MNADGPALKLTNICKRFGALQANDRINLEVARGEVLALLGENGAGKSTLVSILFGHYVADSGRIEVFGKPLAPGNPKAALAAGIGIVHQHFALADNLSVSDNIRLGTESLWRFTSNTVATNAAIAMTSEQYGLKIDSQALVGALSVGEQQRVELLKALVRGAKLLILDEPTAVLTPQECEALFATLRQMVAGGMSIIFISHKLDEVMRLSDRVAVLRHGKLVATAKTSETNPQQLANWMVGQAVTSTAVAPAHTTPGKPMCELRGLSAALSAREQLHSANLSLLGGQIAAIAGVSGNGQRALAQCLMGQLKPSAGTLHMHAKQIARVPDDRKNLGVVGDLSVWENAVLEHLPHFSRWGWLHRRRAKAYASKLVAQFDVRGVADGGASTLPVAQLSGGNIQKLILGRALSRPNAEAVGEAMGEAVELVVAHQPTWGLDVGAVAFVHQQLLAARDAGAAVLLLSDDLDEILRLADRIAVIHGGHLSDCKAKVDWSREAIGLSMAGMAFKGDHAA